MTTFWLLTGSLSLLAVLLVIWPWLFQKKYREEAELYSAEERTKANVRIYKERNRELYSDFSAGRISQDAYDELKAELEASLIDDANHNGANEAQGDGSARLTWIPLSVLVAALISSSYFLYDRFGAYEQVSILYDSMFSNEEISEARALAEAGDARGVLVKLRDKLRSGSNQNDIEGWMLLARTSMNVEQFDLAAEAYGVLADLESQTPELQASILGLQAQALFFQSGNIEAADVQAVLSKAFLLDKNEVNSLGLLSIAAFDKGAYQTAIENWEKILVVAPDHPSKSAIEQGIARARFELGDRAISPTDLQTNADVQDEREARTPLEGQEPYLMIEVGFDDALANRLLGDETLFIFARAHAGPPMPLAVARFSIGNIPSTVRLDDSMAMMPSMKLSMFDEVDVVARITKSGTVTAVAGDYDHVVGKVIVKERSRGVIPITLGLEDLVSAE